MKKSLSRLLLLIALLSATLPVSAAGNAADIALMIADAESTVDAMLNPHRATKPEWKKTKLATMPLGGEVLAASASGEYLMVLTDAEVILLSWEVNKPQIHTRSALHGPAAFRRARQPIGAIVKHNAAGTKAELHSSEFAGSFSVSLSQDQFEVEHNAKSAIPLCQWLTASYAEGKNYYTQITIDDQVLRQKDVTPPKQVWSAHCAKLTSFFPLQKHLVMGWVDTDGTLRASRASCKADCTRWDYDSVQLANLGHVFLIEDIGGDGTLDVLVTSDNPQFAGDRFSAYEWTSALQNVARIEFDRGIAAAALASTKQGGRAVIAIERTDSNGTYTLWRLN